jgi:hypothetical protein
MKQLPEPARQTPLVSEAHVIVCGGGPAGIGAALTAARAGAKVILLEVNGCLGGVWTAGLLSWLFEMEHDGIARELTRDLDRLGARRNFCTHNDDRYAYDAEIMKVLLEEKMAEAGVEIHLHTRVVAALTRDRKIEAVITESKSGREAYVAPCFIDATGDGDLAARCGCGFDLGKAGSGELQPFTFMALVTVRDAEALKPYIIHVEDLSHAGFIRPTTKFRATIQEAGIETSYQACTLFHIRDNLLALMINHEYGVSPIDERDVTKASIQGRAEVHRVVNALRAKGGVFAEMVIVASAEQIGTREGRRIHGRYTVTVDDMKIGIKHDDAVCRVRYWIDVHSTNPKKGKGFENDEGGANTQAVEPGKEKNATQPYDIPLRALIAKDIDNLMMAGRCISGDFLAHSSYRVTGVAVTLGQAAGATCALAAARKQLPSEISATEMRTTLQRLIKT